MQNDQGTVSLTEAHWKGKTSSSDVLPSWHRASGGFWLWLWTSEPNLTVLHGPAQVCALNLCFLLVPKWNTTHWVSQTSVKGSTITQWLGKFKANSMGRNSIYKGTQGRKSRSFFFSSLGLDLLERVYERFGASHIQAMHMTTQKEF